MSNISLDSLCGSNILCVVDKDITLVISVNTIKSLECAIKLCKKKEKNCKLSFGVMGSLEFGSTVNWSNSLVEMARIERENLPFNWDNFCIDYVGESTLSLMKSCISGVNNFCEGDTPNVIKSIIMLCSLYVTLVEKLGIAGRDLCYLPFWWSLRETKYSWLTELPFNELIDSMSCESWDESISHACEETVLNISNLVDCVRRYIVGLSEVCLNSTCKKIYTYIRRKGDSSISSISDVVGNSSKTIRKYVKELEALGWVETSYKGVTLHVKYVKGK